MLLITFRSHSLFANATASWPLSSYYIITSLIIIGIPVQLQDKHKHVLSFTWDLHCLSFPSLSYWSLHLNSHLFLKYFKSALWSLMWDWEEMQQIFGIVLGGEYRYRNRKPHIHSNRGRFSRLSEIIFVFNKTLKVQYPNGK